MWLYSYSQFQRVHCSLFWRIFCTLVVLFVFVELEASSQVVESEEKESGKQQGGLETNGQLSADPDNEIVQFESPEVYSPEVFEHGMAETESEEEEEQVGEDGQLRPQLLELSESPDSDIPDVEENEVADWNSMLQRDHKASAHASDEEKSEEAEQERPKQDEHEKKDDTQEQERPKQDEHEKKDDTQDDQKEQERPKQDEHEKKDDTQDDQKDGQKEPTSDASEDEGAQEDPVLLKIRETLYSESSEDGEDGEESPKDTLEEQEEELSEEEQQRRREEKEAAEIKAELERQAATRVRVENMERLGCSDIGNTRLQNDEGTKRMTCADLSAECHGEDESMYVRAVCPMTCGTCNMPCQDVDHTLLAGPNHTELFCADLKGICYAKEWGDLVLRLCPVSCGVCRRPTAYEIRNSTRALSRFLNHQPDEWIAVPPISRFSAEPWRIPGILHQTWKNYQMPVKYADTLASWRRLHPHWTFEFWDDLRSIELVTQEFPRYAATFRQMPGIKKADVARLVALYVYGGVYADIDVEAARSFDPLLEAAAEARAGVLLGEENTVHTILLERRFSEQLVSNAVMVSCARHPFWLEVLNEIFTNENCGDDPVLCTGPRLVDKFSLRQSGCESQYGCVVRLPYYFFYPQVAHWNSDGMKLGCRSLSRMAHVFENGKILRRVNKACKQFDHVVQYSLALQRPRTFAVHKWQCSWCREDPALKRKFAFSEVVYKVGNESLHQLCQERGKTNHTLSTLLLGNPLQTLEQSRGVVLVDSYSFTQWVYNAYPNACPEILSNSNFSGMWNAFEDEPNTLHAKYSRRSLITSLNASFVSSRAVAVLAAGSSFVVALARKIDALFASPNKLILPK